MAGSLDALLDRFGPISLDELDRRAALQRRVDRKYVVPDAVLAELAAPLAGDHDALEIGGRRSFPYQSVYFDTPDLRCFHDHREDRAPRFKLRTRLYEATGACFFEVKLKHADGETDKRSIEHDPAEHATLTREARALVDEALGEAGVEPPQELSPALVTRFRRVTLAARDGSERVTADLDLRLGRPGGDAVELPPDRVVVEAKSEDGDGACDRLMAGAGIESISFSKYRLGIGLLAAPGADERHGGDLRALFGRAEPETVPG